MATFIVLMAGIAVSTTLGLREAAQRREADRQRYVANIIAVESSLRVGEIAQAQRRLSMCPPNLRGWEWFYFEKRVDASAATPTGHEASVKAVAFSPDGARIASGSGDKTVRLW